MHCQLIVDLVKEAFNTTNTLSKRCVVQHHKLIINKDKFEHSRDHSKKSLKISKHLHTNIFHHVSQRYIDINWTCYGLQFSVDSPYIALSMMADIDTLSIENCQGKIVKFVFLYNMYILVNFVLVLNMC